MLFVGNALLDVSVECDISLLSKYKLTLDESSVFEKWQLPLLDEVINNPTAIVSPARLASLLLKKQFGKSNCVHFLGTIGNDNFGKILRERIEGTGVNALYDVNEKEPTGVAVGLITSDHRTLVANLGATKTFHSEFILNDNVQKAIENSRLIHIEGFFVSHSPQVSLKLVENFNSNGKIVSIGLSAKYVVSDDFDKVYALMPFTDIIFGNYGEARTFVKTLLKSEDEIDIENVAQKILEIPKNKSFTLNGRETKKLVFITGGPKPLVVGIKNADNSCSIHKYEIPKVEIKGDTIGAGDAFLAGVIVKLSQNSTLEAAINNGIKTAAECCLHRGCFIE
ncbi:adenosine kinase-like protein [Dinothrombium tinctorium]|uniref:Adenosine kinase n=1 Tax=Dinothrombium tinctorium TaxID=1965070 RepID=A0A3S3PBF8_9ACAR|nr:adenosine kinase-like protein [Dinothrombium tinctorium]RWS10310.1 adenosine kinase-like protein [Dinothrombium tinctorium]RWS16162.1 adenosine kinase-like protein [Dinothrombium tinctorium]